MDIASSPGPSQLFSLAGKKRERAWDLKSHDKCWQNGVAPCSLATKHRFQTCLASLVNQTKLCEASKDRTTLADSQCSLLFHLYQTRELENRACPRAIFTVHHPSYPSIWAYVTHVTLDPRLPLFSRVR